MHSEIRTGSGETPSAAIAAAMGAAVAAPDDDVRPVVIIEGIEKTPEGFRATVRVLFFTLEEERENRHELSELEEREIRNALHEREIERNEEELEHRHEEVEEEWNRIHREAMEIHIYEGHEIHPSVALMSFPGGKTYEAFDQAAHVPEPEYDYTSMTDILHTSAEYAVLPELSWNWNVEEFGLTDDFKNKPRHKADLLTLDLVA